VRRRPAARRWLLLGVTLLGGAWVLTPAATPLYDGLPVPADRYRYLEPPPGVRNGGPPLSAHATIQLIGGGNSPIDLPTAERPPQAELSLHHGDVEGNRPDVPAVTTAEVRITAVSPPDVPLPAGRQLHGNVYDVSVIADGVSLQMRPASTATIALRQPRGSDADPAIAVVQDGSWRLLPTRKGIGAGVLTAPLPALGNVAILERTSGFVSTTSHTRRNAAIVAVIVTAVATTLLLIRRRRLAHRRR
jgi:hypothetical protein